jgi:hypothetical protein
VPVEPDQGASGIARQPQHCARDRGTLWACMSLSVFHLICGGAEP